METNQKYPKFCFYHTGREAIAIGEWKGNLMKDINTGGMLRGLVFQDNGMFFEHFVADCDIMELVDNVT